MKSPTVATSWLTSAAVTVLIGRISTGNKICFTKPALEVTLLHDLFRISAKVSQGINPLNKKVV
jgi:hypothetical protein